MKNKLIILATGIPYLILAPSAFAIDVCPADPPGSVLCKWTSGNLGPIVAGILNAVFIIAIVAALAYLVYGGVKWIISEGDKSKVQDARSHIVAAVIGLIIVFLSYFIINLILQIFGLGSINTINIKSISPSP